MRGRAHHQNVPADFDRLLNYEAHLRRYLRTGGRWVAGTLLQFSSKELDGVRYRASLCARLVGLCNSNLGGRTQIPHRYEEVECGRLVAVGVSLQNAPLDIRQTALHDCFEYDLSNCHFSIIMQLAQRLDLELTEVDWYLKNKLAVREALGARIGVSDTDLVKRCIISGCIYGARSSLWTEASIPQLIGRPAARRLYADPQYRALKAEVTCARKETLKRARVEYGLLFNAAGCSTSIFDEDPRTGKPKRDRRGRPKRKTPAQLFSHLVLGEEARMLRAVIEAHPDSVVLPMHDGFVSRQELDCADLERLILDKTGFEMKFEVERLQAPAA